MGEPARAAKFFYDRNHPLTYLERHGPMETSSSATPAHRHLFDSVFLTTAPIEFLMGQSPARLRGAGVSGAGHLIRRRGCSARRLKLSGVACELILNPANRVPRELVIPMHYRSFLLRWLACSREAVRRTGERISVAGG